MRSSRACGDQRIACYIDDNIAGGQTGGRRSLPRIRRRVGDRCRAACQGEPASAQETVETTPTVLKKQHAISSPSFLISLQANGRKNFILII